MLKVTHNAHSLGPNKPKAGGRTKHEVRTLLNTKFDGRIVLLTMTRPKRSRTFFLELECKECGYQFHNQNFSVLLKAKYGCKRCAASKVERKTQVYKPRPHLVKTDAQFQLDLKTKLPRVTSLQKYVNSVTKLEVVCLDCDRQWTARPNDLLSGRSKCKVCSFVNRKVPYVEYKLGKRVVKVQGWESQALDYLVEQGYKANKLKVFSEGLNVIKYKCDDEERHYLPDFKYGKTIIEVKSPYTLLGNKQWLKQNRKKAKAVISSGMKFKMLVVTKKDSEYICSILPNNWHSLKSNSLKEVLTNVESNT